MTKQLKMFCYLQNARVSFDQAKIKIQVDIFFKKYFFSHKEEANWKARETWMNYKTSYNNALQSVYGQF